MNRTTVLILALVLFLAHILALHHDQVGAFALPSDIAHVNFQIGRNLVHGQGTVWSPGGSPAAILEEGGTSLLWGLVAAGAELFAWSPVRTTAALGIIAALLAMAFTARLSRERLVGVTATVLLVVSGSFASTAADGSETALFTMLVALAFLALERRRATWLGLSLGMLVLTGSLGFVLVLGFLGAAVHHRRCDGKSLRLLPAFVPPVAALGLLIIGRLAHGAPALTPNLALLLQFDLDSVRLGLWSVEGLVRGTIAPILLLFPILQVLRGRLSGTGMRALGLGLLWVLVVVLTGGDGRPMHAAFVPALPLLFTAVQEAIVVGLDRRPHNEWLAWASLAVACLGSVMASKIPGDLGPVRSGPALMAMAKNRPAVAEAWGSEWNGRFALTEDLRSSERLRAVGIFLRDQVPAEASIVTPWPGAIGYLSRKRVFDLLGRAGSMGGQPTRSWRGRVRTDVVAVLEARPDYVVPMLAGRMRPPSHSELIETWLVAYDEVGDTPERRTAMAAALEPYELVAVPVPEREEELTLPSVAPGFLLRLRSLDLGPRLSLVPDGVEVGVLVEHGGHHQIAELEVTAETPGGATLYLRPNGSFSSSPARARTETLLFPTGTRRVELTHTRLPASLLVDGEPLPGLRITARLVTPFSDSNDPLAASCEPVVLEY